jgi:hypothetical protein
LDEDSIPALDGLRDENAGPLASGASGRAAISSTDEELADIEAIVSCACAELITNKKVVYLKILFIFRGTPRALSGL